MNIYLLKPQTPQPKIWSPYWDKVFGFVIRAMSETEARKLATANAGDETSEDPNAWLDPKLSTCEVLAFFIQGEEEIILRQFAPG